MWAPKCSRVSNLTLLAGAFHAHCQTLTPGAAMHSRSTRPDLLPGESTRARRVRTCIVSQWLGRVRRDKDSDYSMYKVFRGPDFCWSDFPLDAKNRMSPIVSNCSSIPSFWVSSRIGFPFLCAQMVPIICFLNVSYTTARSIHIPTKSDWFNSH